MLRQGLSCRKREQNHPREKAGGAAGEGLSGRLGLWRVAIPTVEPGKGMSPREGCLRGTMLGEG